MAEGDPIKDWRQMRDEERAQRRATMQSWRMGRRANRPRPNPMVPGAVLLIMGSIFLLSNLGIVGPYFWSDFWPVVLIFIGAMQAIFRRGPIERMWGGWMIAMGVLFLAHNLGYIRGPIWQLAWPMALILLGVMFLLRGYQRRMGGDASGCATGSPFFSGGNANPHVLDEHAVFGGIQRRVDSQEFEGGQITSIFGGVHLDLRGASTKKDEMVIEMNAIFGGVELLVPDTWDVTVRGEAIFGGFEDKTMRRREPPAGKRPHLVITGSAVFGGVTVS
jgi:predicted membrane protein